LVVIAGPGSGKTRTLVERARVILAGEPDSNLAFVTFTRTSRRDTKKKLQNVLSADRETRAQDFPRVSTLHGFAKSVVHKAPSVVGLTPGFVVVVPDKEQAIILEEVIQDLGLDISQVALRKVIAYQKNTGVLMGLDTIDPAGLSQATARYEQLCCFYDAIDIEGLVNAATTIVDIGAIDLPPLYFHADEFQDLNVSDQKLVQALLSKGQQDVVVVGDDDQSIYGRRDAKPQGIRDLFGDSQWEKVTFDKCHRLPPHILRATQALIKQHQGPRLDKKIQIPADDGRRVPMSICTTDDIEIELVASVMKQEIQKGKDEPKLSYRDFMVLCPTRGIANSCAKRLQEKWGIPVRQVGPKSIPDDLWRILLLLRMASGDDSLALRQWLELLNLPPDWIRELRDQALAQEKTLFDLVRESANVKLRQFMKDLAALRAVRDDPAELLQKAKFLAGISALPFEIEATSLSGLISELYEEYGLLDTEETDTQDDEVLVTTLHSSKGLEAAVVFIVQLNTRYMPNQSRDRDEELRVLYVGMTRAKKELYLSSSYIFDTKKSYRYPSPSPFLTAINGHLKVQKISRKKSTKKRAR
jgi:DNA helicase-2/ATP-dependent DNA helicase PcrA